MSVKYNNKPKTRRQYDGPDRQTVREVLREQESPRTTLGDLIADTEAGAKVIAEAKAAEAAKAEASAQARTTAEAWAAEIARLCEELQIPCSEARARALSWGTNPGHLVTALKEAAGQPKVYAECFDIIAERYCMPRDIPQFVRSAFRKAEYERDFCEHTLAGDTLHKA